ncbi:U-box domain-containing protein 17 [Platanthera zijinensis]|uniref:U-box domain-containing protein 17 n=1 Tax=Platanthera zijinensis TaxID=2320716 RepID=A0AAP0BRW4_9ASPA
MITCLKELYIVIHRARILLDFCSQSSQICLLLQNPQISGHFHDLNIEIATILDVFPLRELNFFPVMSGSRSSFSTGIADGPTFSWSLETRHSDFTSFRSWKILKRARYPIRPICNQLSFIV